MELSPEIRKEILKAQRIEITEYHVYHKIAKTLPNEDNRHIVEKIGDDEKRHYEVWKGHTKKRSNPAASKFGCTPPSATFLAIPLV